MLDTDLIKHQEYFGSSNEFIKSLKQNSASSNWETSGHILSEVTQRLASCNYELGTKWGQEVSTPFRLHVTNINIVFG